MNVWNEKRVFRIQIIGIYLQKSLSLKKTFNHGKRHQGLGLDQALHIQ